MILPFLLIFSSDCVVYLMYSEGILRFKRPLELTEGYHIKILLKVVDMLEESLMNQFFSVLVE